MLLFYWISKEKMELRVYLRAEAPPFPWWTVKAEIVDEQLIVKEILISLAGKEETDELYKTGRPHVLSGLILDCTVSFSFFAPTEKGCQNRPTDSQSPFEPWPIGLWVQ